MSGGSRRGGRFHGVDKAKMADSGSRRVEVDQLRLSPVFRVRQSPCYTPKM